MTTRGITIEGVFVDAPAPDATIERMKALTPEQWDAFKAELTAALRRVTNAHEAPILRLPPGALDLSTTIDWSSVEPEPPEVSPVDINGVHCLICKSDIVSTHHHDCRRCQCPEDSHVFVDGGADYRRRGWGPKAHFRDLYTGKVTKGSEA